MLANRAATDVDPYDPIAAKQIVADYVRTFEELSARDEWPARIEDLPHPKQTIKAAIRTSAIALASNGLLTDELHDFLQATYVSLADYVAADLVRLVRGYQHATVDLAAGPRLVHEKVQGDAWRTVAETGALAGEIARSIAQETELLREEFRQFVT